MWNVVNQKLVKHAYYRSLHQHLRLVITLH